MRQNINNIYKASSLFKIGRLFVFMLAVWAGFGQAAGAQTTVTLTSSKVTSNDEGYSTNNYGNSPTTFIANESGFRERIFMQFDLSSIPSNATITSAQLRLVHINATNCNTYTEGGSSFVIGVRRVTTPWVEGTACYAAQSGSLTWTSAGATNWTTAGGDFNATDYATFSGGAPDATGTVYTANIATLVSEWLTGTPNNGLALLPQGSGVNFFLVNSDEATNAADRPQLIVTYTLQPAATAVVSPATTCGGAQGSIVQTVTGGTAPYTYAWSGSAVTTKDRTGLTAGNYTVTITDAVSASSTYTYTVGSGCTATITSTKATYNYQAGSTKNWGNDGVLTFEPVSGSLVNSFIEFDLSTLPAGAIISSAQLRLVHSDNVLSCDGFRGGGISFSTQIRRITKAWVEGTICNTAQTGSLTYNSAGASNWTTPGGDFATSVYGSFNGGDPDVEGTVYTVDITTLANEWFNNTYPNYGLALAPPIVSGSNWYNVYSDDAVNAANRPQLIVTYTLLPSATAVVTPTNCGGANGSILQTVMGGTAPYTYAWADGATTNNRTGLLAGTYTVTITDAASATVSYTYNVANGSGVTNGANAIDLIGQYTTAGGFTNNYTQSVINNNSTVNALGFNLPICMAMDAVNKRLFVTDASNNRVLVFNLDANNNLVDKTPDFVLGQTNFTSNTAGTTATNLSLPHGLVYDATNQRLFVADYYNSRVLVYDVASITNGEAAVNVLGQSNFTTSSGATTQTGMNSPVGMTYDAANKRLFVTDGFNNNRVLVYDVASITNGEAAVNVLGQTTFTTGTGATTQTGMINPIGVTYDATNNRLFVTDFGNNRVLVYDVASITNGEAAVNVLGQSIFTTSTAATTQAGMDTPRSSTFDASSNRLYVSQQGANRVTIYDVATITNGEAAVNVLGQPDFTTGTKNVFSRAGISRCNQLKIVCDRQR
jgi:DNA-binding beta-propeller fold protein YncE